jgi:hypothetical protein
MYAILSSWEDEVWFRCASMLVCPGLSTWKVQSQSRDCVMTETRLQFDMRVRVLFENMETPIYGGTMAMLRLVD